MHRTAVVTLLGSLAITATAQCTLGDGSTINCGDFTSGQNPSGDLSCGVDPQDFSNSLGLGLNVCQCDDSTYTVAVTFTGADAAVTTSSVAATLASGPPTYTTVAFNFDEAYSSLPVGSDVSFGIVRTISGQEQDYGPYSFNFQPITSIYSETTTVTDQEVGPATTTTSTETVVVTDTSSVPQSTVASNCATGTKTVYAPRVTFKPITIRPAKTTTYTVIRLATKTNYLTCLPTGFPFKLPKLFKRADSFERRQAAGGVYEQAYCPAISGPPVSTTYTATASTTTTSYPTETATEVQTSTTTITQGPNPPTTTICKNCKVTTTITPVITIPIISIPPKVIYKTTVTKTLTLSYGPPKPKICQATTTTKKPYSLPTGLIPLIPWFHKPVTTTKRY